MSVGEGNGSRARAVMLGALIRTLRKSLGASQSRLAAELCQVAKHATVTRENISRWESGKRMPGAWWLRHLATVLQVPLEVLERAGVDRRHFVTTIIGGGIAPLVASDLIEHGFAADLVVVQQQLDTPGLWAVSATLATLYGKTFPGTDATKALDWYRHAATFADRSGDQDTRIWVRGRAAIALGYEGACLDAAAIRGDARTAMVLLDEGRRVFDTAGSDETESDYAVPWWRFNVFISLMAARLGAERLALRAQDEAARTLPTSLPRFRTHLEMHRGLMLVRAGDRDGGVTYARAALDALPADKHSLTLRMLMTEIERF